MLVVVLLGGTFAARIMADDEKPEAKAAAEAAPEEPALTPEQERLQKMFFSIQWVEAPEKGALGSLAEVAIPEGFHFTAAQGAGIWMELCQNPPNPNLLGLLMPKDTADWFLTFSYMDIGHVPDTEKESLDADALLESFKAGTEANNAERRKRNWGEMRILGWLTPPAYDAETHNLAWALRAESEGTEVANYDMRVLGRTGVMSVKLVANPNEVPKLVPEVRKILAGYHFKTGNQYAEWHAGDKVAEYGLAGLITGGAAVVAAKTGLLAKLFAVLAKGGKAIILAVGALGAAIWKGVSALFGKKAKS